MRKILFLLGFICLIRSSLAFAVEEGGEFYLSNGIKVIHKYLPEAEIVSFGVYLDGGSFNITAENQGVENFLMNMFLKGSEKYSKEQIDGFITLSRSTFGNSFNYEFSYLYCKTLANYFSQALYILADGIKNPAFPSEEMNKVKTVLLNTLTRDETTPDEKIWHVTNEIFLNEHPYYKLPDGRVATVRDLTVNDLKEHRDKIVSAGRIFLVYVGNLERDELERMLDDKFGDIQGDEYERPETPEIKTSPENDINLHQQDGLTTAYIVAKFPAPSPADSLYYAYQLAMSVLTDRLKLSLRTRNNLTYATYAGLASYRANWGFMYATSNQPDKAVELMKDEVVTLKNDRVQADELERVKNMSITYNYMGDATTDRVMHKLGWHEAMLGGWQNSGEYLERVNSVTSEDIQKAVKKYVTFYKFGVITDTTSVPVDESIFIE